MDGIDSTVNDLCTAYKNNALKERVQDIINNDNDGSKIIIRLYQY